MTEELCWELFKKTGQINYYMLYKALKKEETSGRHKCNGHCAKSNALQG